MPPTHKTLSPQSYTPNLTFASIHKTEMLHYPKLNIKTAYKTCLNFLSQIHWFPSHWLKDKTKKLAIYHSSGPWKTALKSFDKMHEKIRLKKRNLRHPEIGLHPIINPLPLKYTTPPLALNKGYHTSVTKHQDMANLAGFYTPLALPAASHWDARCSRLLYLSSTPPAPPPPPRGRQAAR